VPGALVYLPAPPAPAIVCYVGALAGGLAWWHTRGVHPAAARRIGGAALALAGVAAGLAAWPVLRPPDGRLRVSVLDVGQGDAIVVRAPDGATLVVDAGSGGRYRLDAGERVVAPFLWNQGALRLTATLVTHLDLDHAGGMGALHRRFNVSEVWGRATFERGPRWLGGVMISLLDPLAGAATASAAAALPRPGVRPVTPSNAASLVLRLEFGLASLLLASDIGTAQEEALVTGGAPVGATVLKVAHHGSGGSSSASFLRVVQPAVAIVSVGVRNSYRHPHPATLARLEAVGARTYRTDRDGAILLETDGRVLTVTATVGGTVDRYCLDPETLC
jgi:competence protein ComEC